MHSPGHRLTAQSRQRTGQPDSIASDAKPLRCSIAAAHQAHALQNSLFSAVSDQQRVKFKLMQRATMLKPAHLFVVQVTTALWCRLQPLRCRLQPLFLKKAVVKSCNLLQWPRAKKGPGRPGPGERERETRRESFIRNNLHNGHCIPSKGEPRERERERESFIGSRAKVSHSLYFYLNDSTLR